MKTLQQYVNNYFENTTGHTYQRTFTDAFRIGQCYIITFARWAADRGASVDFSFDFKGKPQLRVFVKTSREMTLEKFEGKPFYQLLEDAQAYIEKNTEDPSKVDEQREAINRELRKVFKVK